MDRNDPDNGNSSKGFKKVDLLTSSDEFFAEVVSEAFRQRKIETYPHVQSYLVNLLSYYLDSRNLFDVDDMAIVGSDFAAARPPKTLAEMLLVASNSDEPQRTKLFKKLADKSLYISGFFGDSLENKIVDVDYYINMGGSAYRFLAKNSRGEAESKVYSIFASRFYEFVDALTYISQKSLVKSNESILKLYDRYLRTGSSIARDKLLEVGVLTIPDKKRNL